MNEQAKSCKTKRTMVLKVKSSRYNKIFLVLNIVLNMTWQWHDFSLLRAKLKNYLFRLLCFLNCVSF